MRFGDTIWFRDLHMTDGQTFAQIICVCRSAPKRTVAAAFAMAARELGPGWRACGPPTDADRRYADALGIPLVSASLTVDPDNAEATKY